MASLVAGVAIFAVLAAVADPGRLIAEIGRASPIWLVPFLIGNLAFYVIRAWRWKILLSPLKGDIGLGVVFWTTVVGYTVNIVVPLRFVGEFARAYVIGVKERVGFPQSLLTVGLERVLDLLGITVIGILALSTLPLSADLPSGVLPLLDALRLAGGFAVIALIVVLVGARREDSMAQLLRKIFGFVGRFSEKWRLKIVEAIGSLLHGARLISDRPLVLGVAVAQSLLVWGVFFLGFYALFFSFGINASISVLLLGIMLMQLTFILPGPPAYLGTYEFFWVLIFSGLGLGPIETLVAMAVVSHFLGFLLTLALGFLGAFQIKMTLSSLARLSIK